MAAGASSEARENAWCCGRGVEDEFGWRGEYYVCKGCVCGHGLGKKPPTMEHFFPPCAHHSTTPTIPETKNLMCGLFVFKPFVRSWFVQRPALSLVPIHD